MVENPLIGVPVVSFGIRVGNIARREKKKKQNKKQNVRLTTNTSRDREMAQTLASTTREWGLGRVVRTASSVLRLRIKPECPEDNTRELI